MSDDTSDSPLETSPLDGAHRALGARMVSFGGWYMPVSYPAGTTSELAACRTATALFDASHLGSLTLRGPDAFDQRGTEVAARLVDLHFVGSRRDARWGNQSRRSGCSRRIWSNIGWALNQLAKSPDTCRWVTEATSSSMITGVPAASASNWA